MIDLPDVTLVAIDSVACPLTRMALEDALEVVAPAATLVFSDQDIRPIDTASSWIATQQLRSLDDVASVLWNKMPAHVTTSHMMIVQWDGWPVNGDAWTDDFLRYDYVGAPWPWHDRYAVGNGGFSLRSTSLMRSVARLMPPKAVGQPEDEAICRAYRQRLEYLGFSWAPVTLAQRFSVEHGDADNAPFGFHDVRNWTRFLPRESVAVRVAIANDYVCTKIGFDEVEKWLDASAPDAVA